MTTTNHKTDGIYLPADDRRHYVAWSNFTKENFTPKYWNRLWRWYHDGGQALQFGVTLTGVAPAGGVACSAEVSGYTVPML